MKINAIILAAGKGTRMKSDKPKVVHEVLYKPMINHVVDVCRKVADNIVVVVGYQAEEVKKLLSNDIQTVYQDKQLGTGHAVLCAKEVLKDSSGLTLVLNGDAPLVQEETLRNLIQTHIDANAKATVMSAKCDTSVQYGRVVKEGDNVVGIVEFKDLLPEHKDIIEMNTGEYCFDNEALFDALSKVNNNNAQNEYYLTDVIGILHDEGKAIASYMIDDFDEVGGINDRLALAKATKTLQRRINEQFLLNGVSIIDIDNTYISSDVTIGENTVIEPGCKIIGQTVIGKNCQIGPYCEFTNVEISDNVEIKYSVLSDSIVESGTDIGPFARLRTNCHIRENVHIGNFVEMKKADFGKGSKSAHLSYIGDAIVGEGVNIGCGSITSNYDGKNKSLTEIGNNAFIGCNTNLIAPVKVGDNAFIAAGSTITDEVNQDAFAIARARQVNKEGYAKVLEEKRMKIYNERNKK